MCPKGDDPLTTFSDYRSIILQTATVSGTMGGYFRLSFHGQYFSFPANPAYFQAEQCVRAVESLPNVQTARCSVTSSGRFGSTSYLIQFRTFSTYPYENNIYINDGNPPDSAFACDSTAVTGSYGVTCKVSTVATNIVPGLSLTNCVVLSEIH